MSYVCLNEMFVCSYNAIYVMYFSFTVYCIHINKCIKCIYNKVVYN